MYFDRKAVSDFVDVKFNDVDSDVFLLPKNLVITIAREYGSSGRYVGKMLAERLNVDFYDKEVIELTSEKLGLNEKYVADIDQRKRDYNVFYNVDDEIYFAQSEVIKKLAKKPCVIIGRCADYVLNNQKNVYRIFLYSDINGKLRRCKKYYNLDKDAALKIMKKTDRNRAKYYEYYTGHRWNDLSNYDIAINVDKLGVLGTTNAIYDVIKSN